MRMSIIQIIFIITICADLILITLFNLLQKRGYYRYIFMVNAIVLLCSILLIAIYEDKVEFSSNTYNLDAMTHDYNVDETRMYIAKSIDEATTKSLVHETNRFTNKDTWYLVEYILPPSKDSQFENSYLTEFDKYKLN